MRPKRHKLAQHSFFPACLLWCSLTLAQNAPAPQVADNWQQVGQAHLQVLFWSIYDASLRTPTGAFDGFEQNMQLELHYLRQFSADDLLNETAKQLAAIASPAEINTWVRQLADIWTGVEKNDRIIFQQTASGSDFFHNGRWLGRINDPQFGPAFVQIWLSPTGQYPKLARQLTGAAPLN